MADPIEVRPHQAPSALGIRATAQRLGHYRWVEQRLFEVLGEWATTVNEAAVSTRLGVHCHHHAWHADLWRDRIPVIPDVSPDAVTVPTSAAFAGFVDEVVAPTDTLERLVGVYRVLVPHLIDACRAHLAATNATTDGPTARVLALVLRDLEHDVADGESLVVALLQSPDDERRADAHRVALEHALATSGGLDGTDALDLVGAGFRP